MDPTMLEQMKGLDLKGMSADQLMAVLAQQTKTGEQKVTGEPTKVSVSQPSVARAPQGAFPGRVRGQAGTTTDRERARKFGFPPAQILVLVDGSPASEKAIDAALHYRRRNDHIYFCHALKLAGTGDEWKAENEELALKGKAIVDDVKSMIAEREIGRWETALIPHTNIHQAVLDYAKNNKIDLIFIGTRGFDPQTHEFYSDSFAKFIMENSHCSAMLVR
jgi:nucleotide-binding universal stress UspA family protein